MQKILAYLVLLLLPLAARGQALSDWYYWFDTDKVPQKSGQVSDQKFRLEADVSNLSIGAHTLFVQVADTAGVYSPPIGTWFYHVPDSKNMDKLFYHVGEGNVMHSVDFGDGKFELDVSEISTGIHTLNLQVMDKNGSVSAINTYLFYKVPTSAKVEKLRYWIDGSQDIKEEAYGQGNFLIDVSECVPGFHYIYYYVVDAAGNPSTVQSAGFYRMPMESRQKLYYWFAGDTIATEVKDFANGFVADVTHVQEGFNTLYTQIVDYGPTDIEAHHFIKVAQTEGSGDLTVACIIDGEIAAEQKVPCHGGVIKLDLDVSNIEVGMHKAMFQVITPTGAGSSIAETYFIRTLTNDDVASMQCSYTIDGFKHYTQKGSLTNGTFHFDLPVDEVEDGLHRIDFMLVAENGATTTQGNAWFFKTPVGGNAIKQYDYWLNDKSNEVHSVTLDEPKDPFQLIKLLPVESEPIRSSCFHFEVKDGKPMMYAKNDIHFRFHDKSGRWVDESKQYVDYNTSATVADIAELKSTQTFERPEENSIKWFKFEAEYGDSIALKSNLASSIQIFSASGKELYAASGSNSVNFGGCHVFEDGTFYVAVHDVTGSAQNVILESKKIEKFCIFEYTPDKVPTVGKTLISMKGNGLNFVKYIELYNDDSCYKTDTIVQSVNELLARIELNRQSTTNSKYSVRVFFNNEEKNESKTIELKDAITVEPIQKGDIVVEVKRENRVGDPYPVQVVVRNTGNTSCYAIPMNIAFDHVENFDDIYFMDFNMLVSETLYESRDYFTYTDNLVGTGKKGLFIPMLIPYLGPYDEVIYTLGIKTKIPHANINLYAWTGEPWHDSSLDIIGSDRKIIKKAAAKDPCGNSSIPPPSDMYPDLNNSDNNGSNGGDTYNPNHIYRPGNTADDVTNFPLGPGRTLRPFLGAAEAIGGIQQGASRMNEDALVRSGALPLGESIDQYRYQYRYNPRSPRDIAHDANPLFIKPRMNAAGRAASGRRSIGDYASGDCNPPLPNPTNPWIPGDPNEITGYLSESGSHYVKTEVVNVGYDIEFENDPEIANAAAHHIVICDTLDAKYFDFDSFEPKTVKLSGKEVELDGTYPFVKSLDMRPEINSIAELRGNFDKKTGIATWDLIALDPMTMEPTDDIMQGILPVNTQDGNGIGNVTYTINLKPNLGDGTEIPNRAGIIFDYNDVIMTPIWTNIIDAVPPTSHVCDLEMLTNDSVRVHFEGTDERSGVWKYTLYAQYGDGTSWEKVAEVDTTCADFKFFADIDYGFCVLATDSAGNVEQKEFVREYALQSYLSGDVDDDGILTMADVKQLTLYVLGVTPLPRDIRRLDVNGDHVITMADVTCLIRILYSSMPPIRRM